MSKQSNKRIKNRGKKLSKYIYLSDDELKNTNQQYLELLNNANAYACENSTRHDLITVKDLKEMVKNISQKDKLIEALEQEIALSDTPSEREKELEQHLDELEKELADIKANTIVPKFKTYDVVYAIFKKNPCLIGSEVKVVKGIIIEANCFFIENYKTVSYVIDIEKIGRIQLNTCDVFATQSEAEAELKKREENNK
jgi:hypothetical protein